MKLKSRRSLAKKVAIVLSALMILDIVLPSAAMALTSGPSQPEVQSFEPIGTSEMVDLFTGDFTYNIPLFELPGPDGGYPFNLAYNSGISMDQEASWVGLGWNLNPGAINRQMRGLPDDFNGETVVKEVDMKDNITYGGGISGDLEIWTFDLSKGTGNFGLGVGINVYYNSYKGVGYSLNFGPNFKLGNNNGLTAGLGLNLTLDAFDGATLSPTLSLSKEFENSSGAISGVGGKFKASYNTRKGLMDLGFDATVSVKPTLESKNKKESNDETVREHKFLKKMGKEQTLPSRSVGVGAQVNYANSAFNPSIGVPMKGKNISVNFKLGGDIFGIFGSVGVSGFYNDQKIKEKVQNVPAYGYLYLDEALSSDMDKTNGPMLDFNREKDGMVRETSPNLAIPSLTHDIYQIQGHGIGGSFRPYRNDIGAVYDRYTQSKFAGGGLGLEGGIGFPVFHIGGSGDINFSKNRSHKWDDNNAFLNNYDFNNNNITGIHEVTYWKRPGETVSEDLNDLDNLVAGNDALKVQMDGFKKLKSNLKDNANNTYNPKTNTQKINEGYRKSRNLAILSLKNDERNGIGYCNIKHYNGPGTYQAEPATSLNTTTRDGKAISEHMGAFVMNTTNGTRYVYALPLYNNKHIESNFTVNSAASCGPTVPINLSGGRPDYKVGPTGSDHYFEQTTMPPYTYSHLLTSILGQDYIDLENDGPTDDDFGYWVKFNHAKITDNYTWKAPYDGANYFQGNKSTAVDDKGSVVAGEKEVWYLATAETKSHIAVFDIQLRTDAKEAAGFYDNGSSTQKFYKLNKVSLYIKDEFRNLGASATPIKEIEFRYNTSLCQGTPNGGGSGKLTLDQLLFKYENNERAMLSPYKFTYGFNPNYDSHKSDRWGNYQDHGGDYCYQVDNPYTKQDRDGDGDIDAADKAIRDQEVSAWSLNKIEMPSGATIEVEYESDDYAYVQDKVAMVMTKMSGIGNRNISGGNIQIYDDWDDGTDPNERKIYFDLKHPISSSLTATEQKDEVGKYIDGTGQVYCKLYMPLRKVNETVWEYVTGYYDIEDHNIDAGSLSGGFYTRGYVQLAQTNVDGKANKLHPFALAGLQFLRSSLPQFANTSGTINSAVASGNDSKAQKVQALFGAFTAIKELFTNYYKNSTNQKDYAKYIDADKSFIRLNTPDRVKYGGGLRVKKLVMNDNWDLVEPTESNSQYGQVYEYTMKEEGEVISSGVAAYEPMVGGDENALRWAKRYSDNIPLFTDNDLFFEFPVNESYYPAPVVGYRKVTVKSLNTDKILNADPTAGYSSSGVSVHEFYTAKDFPVLNDETELKKSQSNPGMKVSHLYIPVPGLGSISIDKLTGTQGYSIQLNDMHGKLKKVSTYGISEDGEMLANPTNWTKYNYFDETFVKNGKIKRRLKNEIPVIINDVDPADATKALFGTKRVGVDYEMFSDMRMARSVSSNGGLSLNVEVTLIPPFMIPVPAFIPWGNVSYDEKTTRLAVTNKIIHRSGIVKSIESYENGAYFKTENLRFDAQTGAPLLTRVNNSFENPIYGYDVPGYMKYENMGPAYETIGLRFTATTDPTPSASDIQPGGTMPDGRTFYILNVPNNSNYAHLRIGDEILVNGNKAIITNQDNNMAIFFVDLSAPNINMSNVDYEIYLVRPAKRNMLETRISPITSMKDPTIGRSEDICNQKVLVPIDFIQTPIITPIWCLDINKDFKNAVEILNAMLQDKPYYTDPLANSEGNYCDRPMWWIHASNSAPVISHFNASFPGQQLYMEVDWSELGFSTIPVRNAPRYMDNCEKNRFTDYLGGVTQPFYAFFQANGIDFTDITNISYSVHAPGIAKLDVDYDNGGGPQTVSNLCNRAWKYYPTDSIMKYDTTWRSTVLYDTIFFKDTIHGIDSVLNSSAVTYTNCQNLLFDDVRLKTVAGNPLTYLDDLRVRPPEMTGEYNVWRPKKTYAYLTERRQSNNIDISTDGTYLMTVFNFDNPFFGECEPAWVKTNEISRYSPYNYEVENKDALEIFSSALISYNGQQAIAVGGNARYNEIGFESFEEYTPGQSIIEYAHSSGNIDIYNQGYTTAGTAYNLYVDYDIVGNNSGTTIIAYSESKNYIDDLQSYNNVELYLDYTYDNVNSQWDMHKGKYAIDITNTVNDVANGNIVFELNNVPTVIQPTNAKYAGTIVVPIELKTPPGVSTNYSQVSIVNTKAHTGKQALKVTDNASYLQSKIFMQDYQTYMISAWVSRDKSNVTTYEQHNTNTDDNIGIEVILYKLDNTLGSIVPINFSPKGEMINGWQKVEGSFLGKANQRLVIKLKNGKVNGVSTPAYFDDIRILPYDAAINTYVYDPENYRLSATLDDNNYASIYYYDEGGNLYLVKKETERGIMTIQESRAYTKEQ